MTAIGHTEEQLIVDLVADVAAITPTAAGEYVTESFEEFISSMFESLSQDLDTAFETFEQEHKHEEELEQAVETATGLEGLAPIYYKNDIVILVLLLLIITALWLEMIWDGERFRSR